MRVHASLYPFFVTNLNRMELIISVRETEKFSMQNEIEPLKMHRFVKYLTETETAYMCSKNRIICI